MVTAKQPRPEFRQLRKYLEELPDGKALSKDKFCHVLGISVHSLESIEQGRMHKGSNIATHSLMHNLTDFLTKSNLLQPDLVSSFVADITERRSVISYLPPLISINVPHIQDPFVLTSFDDVEERLGHYFRKYYVGYHQERQEIKEALTKGLQRVVIYGLGGIGKTTIAAFVARDFVERNQRVLWIETGDADSVRIEKKLLESKVLAEHQYFTTALKNSRIKLIVLDNVWNPRIRNLVENRIPHGIAVLITARGNIETGNRHWISLNGLNETNSLELLSNCSGGIDFSRDNHAKNICKKLHYHPQAIEVVGTRIKRDGEKADLTEIANNIRDYVAHGDIGYEATLAVLIEQNLISPVIEKRYLKAVNDAFKAMGSLFAAHAPTNLLMLLSDAQSNDKTFRFVLNTYLRDFNYVRYDELIDSYLMHDLVHTVAFDKCSPRDLRKGSKACQNYVRKYTTSSPIKFHALYLARDNIQGAVEYALKIKDLGLFYDIISRLALNHYFDAKGYTEEWLIHLEMASDLAVKKGAFHDAHYLCSKVGNDYNSLNQFSKAKEAHEASLSFALRIKDREEALRREAVTLCFIGTMAAKSGDITSAEELLFGKAETKAKGNPLALSQVYEHQGIFTAKYKASLPESFRLFKTSLEMAEQVDLPVCWERIFYAYINMGEVRYLQKDLNTALEYVQLAYNYALRTEKDDLQARALREILEKASVFGQQEIAQQAFNRGQELYHRMEDEIGKRKLNHLAIRYGLLTEHQQSH